MESKKHIDLIDILKGVAIISVLICHSVIVYPVNLENVAWSNALKTFVDSYQMPLFFMISGFLCSYKGNYGGYLLARVKRILVPYIVFDAAALKEQTSRSADYSGLRYCLGAVRLAGDMLPEERCVLSYIFYHRHDAQGLRFRKDKRQAYRYPDSECSGVLSVIHSAENLCRQSVFCCRNIYIRAFGFGFLRLVLLFGENAEIHKESADDKRKIFPSVLFTQCIPGNRSALARGHKSSYHDSRAYSADIVCGKLYCELSCIKVYS